VTEYCNVASLKNLIQRRRIPFEEKYIRPIIYCVLRGLECIHKAGIVHSKVRAASILANTLGQCKLSDFSLSVAEHKALHVPKDTKDMPYWTAPEIMEPEFGVHDYRVDTWSLGITAIELAEGNPPYHFKEPVAAIYSIVHNPPPRLQTNLWFAFFFGRSYF